MALQIISTKDRERLNRYPAFILPEDLKNYYHLSDRDKEEISNQREERNKLGFALQLCTLRHIGFIPTDLTDPPFEISHHLADQLGVATSSIKAYKRQPTQSQHLKQIMSYTGFRRASLLDVLALQEWLGERALEHDKPLVLFEMACDYFYKRKIIRLGITRLERHIAEARSKAHVLTYESLQPLLTEKVTILLNKVLELVEGERYTRLSWLQRTPTSATVTQIRAVLEKISFLYEARVMDWDVSVINPNRLKWLARLGAKISKQNLLNSNMERRISILVAFLHQSLFSYTDDVLDMFDERIWELYGDAKDDFDDDRDKAFKLINENLSAFQVMGEVLVDEQLEDSRIRETAFEKINRQTLIDQLQKNKALIRPANDAYVDYFKRYYSSARNVAKPLLENLNFRVWNEDNGLMEALELVKEIHQAKRHRIPRSAPTQFVPKEWLDYLWIEGEIDRYVYELAAIWVLRIKLRSADIYVDHSRRYIPIASYLIPKADWSGLKLVVHELTNTPLDAKTRLKQRKAELRELCQLVEAKLCEEDSPLTVAKHRLSFIEEEAEDQDPEIAQFKSALAANLVTTDVTDVLVHIDQETGFSEAFEHLGTSKRPAQDVLKSIYACILAQACNLGFAYMANSSQINYHALRDCNDWFISDVTLKAANTILVNKHHDLAFSQNWGAGMLSSSDGQRFPMRKKAKTLKARHNPHYYGLGKGVTFYTWTSDQFSQYGSKPIPSTVRDATFILDEILANETELAIMEHSSDTSGYTELIFAVFDLLGLSFIPRIRDLAGQTLYRTKDMDLSLYPTLAPALTGVIREDIAERYWDEMLRFVGSLKLGYVTASLLIQKLQAYPRKHQLSRALQAYGRLPKTIHCLRWNIQPQLRKRTGVQLNKSEAVHDLRAYIAFANKGKLGTSTNEQLDHQVGCLNLLSNIIIYWNTLKLQASVDKLRVQGYPVNDEHLKHVWPTRYKNVNVYGRYSFDHEAIRELQRQRGLS